MSAEVKQADQGQSENPEIQKAMTGNLSEQFTGLSGKDKAQDKEGRLILFYPFWGFG